MSLFVVYKSALHGQQFPCQTGKGNRMKHLQIYQGLPVWRMLVPCLPAIESPNLKLKKASFQKMFSLPKCLLSICQRTIKKMFNCGQRFYGYLIKYPCMADLSQVAHQNILKFHILMRFFTTALSFERLVYNGNQ